jgi:Tol biopolymer transport system component
MSGRQRDHLVPVPDPRDEVVLDWLLEQEGGASRRVLDGAFAQLGSVAQVRRWPWDRAVDVVRPEPFGSGSRRMVLLVAAAALLIVIVAGLIAAGAIKPSLFLSVAPSPDAALPSATAASPVPTFPLAGDGLEIVFQDGSSSKLFVIEGDGSGRREVGEDVTGALVWPDWLPGTDTILALQGTFEGIEQIWAIDTTGIRKSQVMIPCVPPCQSRNEAAVSHDGSKVVFFQAWGEPVNGIPPECSLQLYDVATQAITPVTDHACGPEERHPRFSPDDTQVAFWRGGPPPAPGPSGEPPAEPEGSALFVLDLPSGAPREVTDWSTHATHLDWSPDGRWLAFVPDVQREAGEPRDVWRVGTDGTGLEKLTDIGTTTGHLFRPIYSPDGHWILFMQVENGQGQLLAVPADGGEPVDVLPGINVLEYDIRSVP